MTLANDRHKLTEREAQMLRLASEGLTEREIADRLGINYNTVRNHLRTAYIRLNVRNKAQAIAATMKGVS